MFPTAVLGQISEPAYDVSTIPAGARLGVLSSKAAGCQTLQHPGAWGLPTTVVGTVGIRRRGKRRRDPLRPLDGNRETKQVAVKESPHRAWRDPQCST